MRQSLSQLSASKLKEGFTIIELITVIGIIGILSAITVVGYGAWQQSVAESSVKSDLLNAASALESARTFDNQVPADINTVFQPTEAVTLTGGATDSSNGFCITAVHEAYPDMPFFITQDTINDGPQSGECPVVFTDISSNGEGAHACGVVDGKAYCWGAGAYGPLGNGSENNANAPVAVSTDGVLAGKTVTAVGAGRYHSCAVADGEAFCWGYNSGRLGNNSSVASLVPVAVSTAGVLAGKTVTAVGAGISHTCALAEGAVYCWGLNSSGQLGDNSTVASLVPVAVSTAGVLAGKTVTDLSVGSYHNCVVADGEAFCWGYNSNNLGNGSTANSSVPVAVSTAGVLAGKEVTDITAASTHSCAVAAGAAYCWGFGTSGKLGVGSTSSSSVPVAVSTAGVLGGVAVSEIAAGTSHSCARSEVAVFCWGSNSSGQLGDASTTNSLVPVTVSSSGVLASLSPEQLTVGNGFSCLIASGQPVCWGYGVSGALGNSANSNSSIPVAVTIPAL
ncbi:MAG TPA: prepilin-type N-terminal cleavage/methylation domain-containing protein [Candidatus Saccharimonadaceae bacterium]|nr:prepilin-type N-terminal cleavage/methylation domain-containing protein [Candidatus Saccharimonadaceae bacterium]